MSTTHKLTNAIIPDGKHVFNLQPPDWPLVPRRPRRRVPDPFHSFTCISGSPDTSCCPSLCCPNCSGGEA